MWVFSAVVVVYMNVMERCGAGGRHTCLINISVEHWSCEQTQFVTAGSSDKLLVSQTTTSEDAPNPTLLPEPVSVCKSSGLVAVASRVSVSMLRKQRMAWAGNPHEGQYRSEMRRSLLCLKLHSTDKKGCGYGYNAPAHQEQVTETTLIANNHETASFSSTSCAQEITQSEFSHIQAFHLHTINQIAT